MKKLFLLLSLVLASIYGFGQATPAMVVRVAGVNTAFGINIAVGTTVIDASNGKQYVCTIATAAACSLSYMSYVNFITDAGGSVTAVTGTGPIVSSGGSTPVISINAATTGSAGSMSAADKTKLDGISGTNTGDQTITLTGPVTGSGTGSFATTITDKAITLAKQADMSTGSFVYRKTAGSGAPEVQTLATVKTDLGLTGTNSGDQTITLTGGVTGSGTGSFAATVVTNANLTGPITSVGNATTITAKAVTLGMQADIATASIMGRTTAGTGAQEVLSVAAVKTMLGQTTSAVYNAEASADALVSPWTIITLAGTPVTISVLLNGMTLKLTNQYTIATTTLTIIIPVYKYDQIQVIYTY